MTLDLVETYKIDGTLEIFYDLIRSEIIMMR